MSNKIVIKLIASMLVLSLTTACGTTNEDNIEEEELQIQGQLQGDPQVDPIMENQSLNIQWNSDQPTKNEMDCNFGKELDGNTEKDDIPGDYLEKDEETESAP